MLDIIQVFQGCGGWWRIGGGYRQSKFSQIYINQYNTKKFPVSGGGWRHKATKNSGRNDSF